MLRRAGLQPDGSIAADDDPGDSSFEDESADDDEQYSIGHVVPIVISAWTHSAFDIVEPPGYEAIIAHLSRLQNYLGVAEDDICIWRPTAEDLEALKFAKRFGSAKSVRGNGLDSKSSSRLGRNRRGSTASNLPLSHNNECSGRWIQPHGHTYQRLLIVRLPTR